MGPGEIRHNWVGKTETQVCDILPAPVLLMAATLDKNEPQISPGDIVPDGWHWAYFHSPVKTYDLGPDGHAEKGGFLPPVPLPARMWAGGRFYFNHPMRIGDRVTKRSIIQSIDEKQGRSGKLAFVTVRHQFIDAHDRVLFIEDHDIVYKESNPYKRSSAIPGEITKPPEWQQTINPGPVLLFRFSALTFNGHRIHYDRDYCRHAEGYPGLVVHGPLTALLLLSLIKENCKGTEIKQFSYRGLQPLFDIAPFQIEGCADGYEGHAWAKTPDGALAMTAEAEFS